MITSDSITYTAFGETFDLVGVSEHYANGRLAIRLVTADIGEPMATVTTNLPDQHLNAGEVFVKDWSENTPIVRALVDAGWLIPTGREVQSGHTFPKVMRLAGPFEGWE